MHIELDRETCLWALDLVSKISTKHQTLPVLQCVLIQANDTGVKFITTNLELSVEVTCDASIKTNGSVAVPAALLLQTINLLTHKTVVLHTEGELLTVESKTSKTKIKTLLSDEFPTIPQLDSKPQKVNGPLFALGIKTAVFAASQSTIKPELGSVYIHQQKEHTLTFVATDSFRLVEKSVPQKSVALESPILIPHRNALEIARVMEVVGEDPEFMVSDNQAAFRFTKGVYITTRLTEGTFPDYKQIIPKEFATHTTLLVADLIHALKKTNIFANKFMQVSFVINVKKGTVTLSSDDNDLGQTTEEISATIDGEDLSLSFNQRYVSEPLGSINEESVILHFAGVGRPMVLEGVSEKSFRYLVMPMNK